MSAQLFEADELYDKGDYEGAYNIVSALEAKNHPRAVGTSLTLQIN
jgi:hypothetical protein